MAMNQPKPCAIVSLTNPDGKWCWFNSLIVAIIFAMKKSGQEPEVAAGGTFMSIFRFVIRH